MFMDSSAPPPRQQLQITEHLGTKVKKKGRKCLQNVNSLLNLTVCQPVESYLRLRGKGIIFIIHSLHCWCC